MTTIYKSGTIPTMPKEILMIRLLPYQKKRLLELADETGKSQSDLVREAISILLGQYKNMGVLNGETPLDKTLD